MKRYTFKCPHCGCTYLRRDFHTTASTYVESMSETEVISESEAFNTDTENEVFACDDCISEWDSVEDLFASGALVEKE